MGSLTQMAGVVFVACSMVASCSSEGNDDAAATTAPATTAASAAPAAAESTTAATTQAAPPATPPPADTVAQPESTTTVAAETTTTMAPREPVVVTGPVTGGVGQATASLLDLGEVGYLEEEYFIEGDATSYDAVATLGVDGEWAVVAAATAPYRSRIIVRRPEASAFSGTVVVEWLNVSSGADANPDWGYASDEIIREGHAWVGVSAQAVGVNGGSTILGAAGSGGLIGTDPVRYGSLIHPGDAFSFDIFTQAATSLSDPDGPAPLGDLEPEHIVAIGESQSAFFLTTYVNAVQPIVGRFDGFFVHSRGGGAPSIAGENDLAVSASDAVAIRSDLDVPVLVFQTETDLTVLGYGYLEQDDSDFVKVWETAGTAHADEYLLVEVYGLGADSDLASIVNCPAPLNAGPQHEILQAALHALVAWVADGSVPPTAPRLQLLSKDPPVIARDERGIALGGIRTPLVDVPVAVLSGDMTAGASGFCALFGSTTPFDAATLASLYPSGDAYLDAFTASLQSTIDAGFMLAEDAAALEAKAAVVASTLG